MAREISPLLNGLIISTFALVAGWLAWHGVADRSGHPLASASMLAEQMHGLPLAQGSSPLGNAKFVDRQTFRYIEQNYSTSMGAKEVFRHYSIALQEAGWKPNYKGQNEEWYCRDGILGAVIFWGNPSTYEIRLTTGSPQCH